MACHVARVVAWRLASLQATLQYREMPIKPKSSKLLKGYTIGLDLGGTKVAAALVDANGKILKESTVKTVPPHLLDSDPKKSNNPSAKDVKAHIAYVVKAMADATEDCASELSKKEKSQIVGLGLASAGPLNIGRGEIVDSSNLKGWKRVPIVNLLRKQAVKRGLTDNIVFQNDAIAASLGEGWIGVAKNKQTYVGVTVGTGIGTGVILNGQPAQSQGMGSEWGHIIADSLNLSKALATPYDREVEGIASGTGLVRRAQSKGLSFTSVHQMAAFARDGDRDAQALFHESAEALAGLFYSLSLGFNPEVFAVSGGMLAVKDLFLPQAIDLYNRAISVKYPSFKKPIKVSKLGVKAGVIGAARLPRLEA